MGEPGVLMGDTLCITVKLFPGRLNPTPLIKDCGVIQDGNVQILPNDPGSTSQTAMTGTGPSAP